MGRTSGATQIPDDVILTAIRMRLDGEKWVYIAAVLDRNERSLQKAVKRIFESVVFSRMADA